MRLLLLGMLSALYSVISSAIACGNSFFYSFYYFGNYTGNYNVASANSYYYYNDSSSSYSTLYINLVSLILNIAEIIIIICFSEGNSIARGIANSLIKRSLRNRRIET